MHMKSSPYRTATKRMKANNVKRYGERRAFLSTEGEEDGDIEMGGFIILGRVSLGLCDGKLLLKYSCG